MSSSRDDRLEELAGQVRALSQRVDELTRLIESGAAARSEAQVGGQGLLLTAPAAGDRVSAPRVLSNLAVVSFLFVVALILRTIVDEHVINGQLGAGLGIGYGFLIITYGYYRYLESWHRAPVFVTCGAFLIFSIVLETHSRFGLLSTPLAYVLLGVTLVVTAAFGLQSGFSSPIWTGIAGATLCSCALEFPDPHYTYLATVLVLANGAAYAAVWVARRRGLIWTVLIFSVLFLSLWTTKVRVPYLRGRPFGPELALPWLLPILAIFAFGYLAMAIALVLRRQGPYRVLESALPFVAAACAYGVVRMAVTPWLGSEVFLGRSGAGASALYLIIAAILARFRGERSHIVTSLTFSGLLLFCASLAALDFRPSTSLLVMSLAALGIWALSEAWSNRMVRAMSYGLQVYACGAAIIAGSFYVAASMPVARIGVAILLCALTLGHFWGRRRAGGSATPNGPSEENRADGLAVVVLWASLVYAFGAARMILYSVLITHTEASEMAFQCGESIIINLCALALAMLGLRRFNRELMSVAMLVAVIGAGKVFGYDLVRTHGIPPVLDVFVFGVTSAVGSLIWARWQHRATQHGEKSDTAGSDSSPSGDTITS